MANLKEMSKEERLDRLRHSAAHVMAEAVVEMFPDARVGIGPPIDTGFYYDFELPRALTLDDLPEIEERMRKRIASDVEFEQSLISKDEARKLFKDQPYKLELIDEIEGETVGHFRHGKFDDLCRGGHTERTGQLGAFRLDRVAGAYWRGDERNTMLQRVYGLLFETQEELDAFIEAREEAERRDHRRLGRELDPFHLDPISPGSPFYHPKGTVLYNGLIDYMRDLYREYGYQEVITPEIFDSSLWHKSGHYENYKDSMFFTQVDEREFVVKPMNCPGHVLLYQAGLHSYRDLPLRLAEYGTVYRYERSGTLQGLTRVRAMCMNDAHIYITEDQIKDEFKRVMDLHRRYYELFGLEGYFFRLSLWDPEDPKGKHKYVDDPAAWEFSERQVREAMLEADLPFVEVIGEAAFYGPKIDVHVKDAIGRRWQVSTIQLDFNLPQRFELEYAASGNVSERPYMIHCAKAGSIERFTAILVEHYAGAFPMWLAPVQVSIIPVADRHDEYADSVSQNLIDAGLRSEVDLSPETAGDKIRRAPTQKHPAVLVVGDDDVANSTVGFRLYGEDKDTRGVPLIEATNRLTGMARRPSL